MPCLIFKTEIFILYFLKTEIFNEFLKAIVLSSQALQFRAV